MASFALSRSALAGCEKAPACLPIALKTPAEMSAMLPAEVEKWAAVIKTAHVTVE